jgi:hypothetical protein
VIKVDGKLFRIDPLAGGTCADADPDDADPVEFLVPSPCPFAVSQVPVAVDVRTLSAGSHSIEFGVQDAAGNATSVYGPLEFPRAKGEAKSLRSLVRPQLRVWFDRNHTHQHTSRYGVRVVTRGLLRARTGHGIRGARIDVYHVLANGQRRLLETGLKTREGGKITLH